MPWADLSKASLILGPVWGEIVVAVPVFDRSAWATNAEVVGRRLPVVGGTPGIVGCRAVDGCFVAGLFGALGHWSLPGTSQVGFAWKLFCPRQAVPASMLGSLSRWATRVNPVATVSSVSSTSLRRWATFSWYVRSP